MNGRTITDIKLEIWSKCTKKERLYDKEENNEISYTNMYESWVAWPTDQGSNNSNNLIIVICRRKFSHKIWIAAKKITFLPYHFWETEGQSDILYYRVGLFAYPSSRVKHTLFLFYKILTYIHNMITGKKGQNLSSSYQGILMQIGRKSSYYLFNIL